MTRSPYPVEGVALARRTLTDGAYMTSVAPAARAELVQMAFDILHKDRTARLGQTPAGVQATILPFTRPALLITRPAHPAQKLALVTTTTRTPGGAA